MAGHKLVFVSSCRIHLSRSGFHSVLHLPVQGSNTFLNQVAPVPDESLRWPHDGRDQRKRLFWKLLVPGTRSFTIYSFMGCLLILWSGRPYWWCQTAFLHCGYLYEQHFIVDEQKLCLSPPTLYPFLARRLGFGGRSSFGQDRRLSIRKSLWEK